MLQFYKKRLPGVNMKKVSRWNTHLYYSIKYGFFRFSKKFFKDFFRIFEGFSGVYVSYLRLLQPGRLFSSPGRRLRTAGVPAPAEFFGSPVRGCGRGTCCVRIL